MHTAIVFSNGTIEKAGHRVSPFLALFFKLFPGCFDRRDKVQVAARYYGRICKPCFECSEIEDLAWDFYCDLSFVAAGLWKVPGMDGLVVGGSLVHDVTTVTTFTYRSR